MSHINNYKNKHFLAKYYLENLGRYLRNYSKMHKIVENRSNFKDNGLVYKGLQNQG